MRRQSTTHPVCLPPDRYLAVCGRKPGLWWDLSSWNWTQACIRRRGCSQVGCRALS